MPDFCSLVSGPTFLGQYNALYALLIQHERLTINRFSAQKWHSDFLQVLVAKDAGSLEEEIFLVIPHSRTPKVEKKRETVLLALSKQILMTKYSQVPTRGLKVEYGCRVPASLS